jgi:hypothetical protein
VHRQHDVLVDQRGPERVPVVGVVAGVAELGRVLGEGHRVHALLGEATDLGGGQLRVPQDGQAHRDEAAGVGAAPGVDVPVVVGLEHGEGEVLVLGRREQPAREPGERREAHRPEDPAGVHVLDPLVDVPAARAHLLEGGRLDAVLLLGPAGHGVEPDVGDHGPVEGPHVGPVGLLDDLRGQVGEPRRQPPLEQVGRLDQVVVDAHQDQVVGVHASPLTDANVSY